MSMPAIERVIPLVGQLPVSMREALARRLRELTGLSLIALAGVAAAALMTWSVQDPSLSHATSRAIRNIVGYPGAIGADLLMQILGLGAVKPAAEPVGWIPRSEHPDVVTAPDELLGQGLHVPVYSTLVRPRIGRYQSDAHAWNRRGPPGRFQACPRLGSGGPPTSCPGPVDRA
jgi:hypothetical protein